MKETDILSRKELFSDLYLAYGSLLSRKTASRMESFYLEDLSLSEIAINEGVSRSAIQQAIKDGEKELLNYERQVGMLEKTKKILALLERIENEKDDEKRSGLIHEAKGVLENGI